MKKLISVLATLILAMWWWSSRPVQAADVVAIDADTVGYDPAQGGLVFNPPSDIWGKVGTTMNIPFMYASRGNLILSERSLTHYMIDQGDGFKEVPTVSDWSKTNFSSVSPNKYILLANYSTCRHALYTNPISSKSGK